MQLSTLKHCKFADVMLAVSTSTQCCQSLHAVLWRSALIAVGVGLPHAESYLLICSIWPTITRVTDTRNNVPWVLEIVAGVRGNP